MARPLMISDEQRRKYAYAVLSGAMTRKEAYSAYIDANSAHPARSASQLQATKRMTAILDEVGREIDSARSIRRTSINMAEKQLEIAGGLLASCEDKSEKEKLAILRIMKPIQDNAMAVLSRLDKPLEAVIEAAQAASGSEDSRRRQYRASQIMV